MKYVRQAGQHFWLADGMDDLDGWDVVSAVMHRVGWGSSTVARGMTKVLVRKDGEERVVLVRTPDPDACPDCGNSGPHRTACPRYDDAVRAGSQPCLHCGPRSSGHRDQEALPQVCPHCGRDKDAGRMV